jgi:hypothetical protein
MYIWMKYWIKLKVDLFVAILLKYWSCLTSVRCLHSINYKKRQQNFTRIQSNIITRLTPKDIVLEQHNEYKHQISCGNFITETKKYVYLNDIAIDSLNPRYDLHNNNGGSIHFMWNHCMQSSHKIPLWFFSNSLATNSTGKFGWP